VTAGTSSGINDGAAGVIVASGKAATTHRLTPMAPVVRMAVAGVAPRVMGIGPLPATAKLFRRLDLTFRDVALIELNEAFAAQALGCLREFGLADDDPRVNPLGRAIALGHPLGMSGARLVVTACHQMRRRALKKALCTMCISVGQGIAMVVEGA
jgi:acetyl-CoA acetyltransferase family protein